MSPTQKEGEESCRLWILQLLGHSWYMPDIRVALRSLDPTLPEALAFSVHLLLRTQIS